MVRRTLLTALAAALCVGAARTQPGSLPTGLWSTPDHGGVVQISRCGDDLCGVIVGVTPSPKGVMPRDVSGVPQCHLTLLRNLHLGDDGRWHGTVRNPEDGQVYNAEVWLGDDGSMQLRGYIGLPLLGQTQTWQPFSGSLAPDCRFH